jgi:5'-phosphate synthase pdxT subunit
VRNVHPPAEVVATLADGAPVIVRQGRLLATSFHPELTDDARVHRYFVELAIQSERAVAP